MKELKHTAEARDTVFNLLVESARQQMSVIVVGTGFNFKWFRGLLNLRQVDDVSLYSYKNDTISAGNISWDEIHFDSGGKIKIYDRNFEMNHEALVVEETDGVVLVEDDWKTVPFALDTLIYPIMKNSPDHCRLVILGQE